MKLYTMRANINLDRFPVGLRIALSQYDDMRKENFEKAEAIFQIKRDEESHSGRLCRGLRKITMKSLKNICTRNSDLCHSYVEIHSGDLKTLQGLFYWNGSDKLTEQILLAAWRKG